MGTGLFRQTTERLRAKLFRTSLVFRLSYQRYRCEKAPCLSYSLLWGLTRVDFCGCFGAAQLLNTTGWHA